MVKIEKIVPGGQGLGTLEDGRKIFLWNALPGEVVTDFKITKKKSHYLEGVATEIEERSEYRVEPKDECYLATSPWQVVNFDYELKLKAELVKEYFRQQNVLNFYKQQSDSILQNVHFGDASPRPSSRGGSLNPLPLSRTLQNVQFCKTSCLTDNMQFFYRNKMEYSLFWDNKAEKIRLAFHERGSHRKKPVGQSSIERREIWKKACEIVEELNVRGEEARKYQSLLLRCNQAGEVEGGLFENGKSHPVFKNLEDTVLGVPFSYSPNGFFQINLPVYEMALEEIRKYIETEKVLDLYAGVGSIGLSVARGKELTLVECDKAAYGEMVRNIGRGDSEIVALTPEKFLAVSPSAAPETIRYSRGETAKNFSGSSKISQESPLPVLAKSEEALEYIQPEQTVIVDPPRAGCDRKLLEKFLGVKPRRIIYLSCNPATQARDVAILQSKYIMSCIKTFNFFPRTPHIENLVVLDISRDE